MSLLFTPVRLRGLEARNRVWVSPIDSLSTKGISPLASIVRYEMHFVASSTRGSTIACVGHASMQRVHVPQ
jgi:2,4-dienoyl-CoA reductase-like NADH-dependent reductase (Old Yellow Enzyme family)